MTLYIPTSSAPAAERLTAALWVLAVPSRGDNVTTNLFGVATMTDGSVWLAVDTEFTIPVHPDADASAIAEILEPFVEAGAITWLEVLGLFDLIEVTRGQSLNVWESFPQYWMNLAKSQEELQTLNLWPVQP